MFDVPVIVLLAALPGVLLGGYFAFFRRQQAPVVSWLAYAVILTGLLCVFGPLIEIGRDPNANLGARDGGDRATAHFLLFLLIVAPVHLLLLLGLIAAAFFAREADRAPDPVPAPRPMHRSRSSDDSGEFGSMPRFPGGN